MLFWKNENPSSNVCMQLLERTYIAIGDGKDVGGSLLVTPEQEDSTYCSDPREEYYCPVNGDLYSAQSCIKSRTNSTFSSPVGNTAPAQMESHASWLVFVWLLSSAKLFMYFSLL